MDNAKKHIGNALTFLEIIFPPPDFAFKLGVRD